MVFHAYHSTGCLRSTGRVLVFALGLLAALAYPAFAEHEPPSGAYAGVATVMARAASPFMPVDGVILPLSPSVSRMSGAEPAAGAPRVAPAAFVTPPRPAALPLLEASFMALQALDVASTVRAMHAGYVEGNPLMRGIAGHPVAFVAVKAGATATTVLLLRRVARRNPVTALVTMAAINTGYALIVARNFRLAPQ